ncbi:peroxisome biogenesis factor 10 [Thoreauomyces humboldtii]|nr:peroxisome biogenesis factor 10 [Thoreauomyces humboldtii]
MSGSDASSPAQRAEALAPIIPSEPPLSHDTFATAAPSPLRFPFASQPDLIRGAQKDAHYQSLLHEQASTVFRSFFGTRTHLKFQNEVALAADAAYRGLTTVAGSRTLGEEYCDIMHLRTLLVLLQVVAPYALTRAASIFARDAKRKPASAKLLGIRLSKLSSALIFLQRVLKSHLAPLHLALFYLAGSFYTLSARILGIRYIFLRQLRPNESRGGYELLGALIVVQLLVRTYLDYRQSGKTDEGDNEQDNDYDE